MISLTLIVIGIIINGLGTLQYVIESIRGKVKPNKVTFFIWSLAPFIAFLAQVNKGVGVQSLMTISVSIFPLSIFLASFVNKKAYWKLNKRDLFCGLLSLIGLLLWYLTKEANLALLFSLFSEGFATLPTVAKAYIHPTTEIAWPWLASVISGVLTLITITNWNFQTYTFPLFYTLEMFVIFMFVQYKLGIKLRRV